MKCQQEYFDTKRLNMISAVSVLRRLGIAFRRKGTLWVTRCLWHGPDNDPSLFVYERTGENHFYCFVCGKSYSVINFVKASQGWSFQEACRWLCKEYCIDTVAGPVPVAKPVEQTQPAQPAYTYIPMMMVDPLVSPESSLCRCLVRLYQPEAVEQIVQDYRLGIYTLNGDDDYTVFPYIDGQDKVYNLKVQHYDCDPKSSLFCHNNGKTYMLGKMWRGEGRFPADAEFHPTCLFGEHLLPRYPQHTVALVESPKNAVFGALEMPELLWIAVGSKSMLTRERLKPLRHCNVIVFPDRDAISLWTEQLESMNDMFNYTVNEFCERHAPADQLKYDIADYLLEQHRHLLK